MSLLSRLTWEMCSTVAWDMGLTVKSGNLVLSQGCLTQKESPRRPSQKTTRTPDEINFTPANFRALRARLRVLLSLSVCSQGGARIRESTNCKAVLYLMLSGSFSETQARESVQTGWLMPSSLSMLLSLPRRGICDDDLHWPTDPWMHFKALLLRGAWHAYRQNLHRKLGLCCPGP